MFATLSPAAPPAAPHLPPILLSVPVARPLSDRAVGTALDHLPPARGDAANGGFDAPAPRQARAGERTAALVEHYLASIACMGEPAPSSAVPAGSLKDQRRVLAQQLLPVQRDALMRHMRLYCRGLGSVVAEVIRRDPAMAPFARAAGDEMARQAASPLAQGLFVPPPDFYRIAYETRARFQGSPQHAAERELAAWRQAMGTFYRRDIRCGNTGKDQARPSAEGCRSSSVTVTGAAALEQALRFLPAGDQHVYQSADSTFSLPVLHEEMRYSGPIRQYFVRQGRESVELQLRASPGGSEYRMDRQDDWAPNPHGVTGIRHHEQVAALLRLQRPARS